MASSSSMAGCSFSLILPGVAFVTPAQTNAVKGDFVQVKRPFALQVKPLAKEAVEAFGDGAFQRKISRQGQLPQIVGLAAFDEGFIPCECGQRQVRLPVAAFPSGSAKTTLSMNVHFCTVHTFSVLLFHQHLS